MPHHVGHDAPSSIDHRSTTMQTEPRNQPTGERCPVELISVEPRTHAELVAAVAVHGGVILLGEPIAPPELSSLTGLPLCRPRNVTLQQRQSSLKDLEAEHSHEFSVAPGQRRTPARVMQSALPRESRIGRVAEAIAERAFRFGASVVEGSRQIAERLKENPYSILLLFPLIATPDRFSKTQKNGLKAIWVVTVALLGPAAWAWSEAITESSSLAMRLFGQQQTAIPDEATRQKLEWGLGVALGKPLIGAIMLFVVTLALIKTGWYKAFWAIWTRGDEHQAKVGLHYFLVQTTSRALYVGLMLWGFFFASNNWLWLEPYFKGAASSGLILLPAAALCLCQSRYLKQISVVNKQLYGSWWAQLVSAIASFAITAGLAALAWRAI